MKKSVGLALLIVTLMVLVLPVAAIGMDNRVGIADVNSPNPPINFDPNNPPGGSGGGGGGVAGDNAGQVASNILTKFGELLYEGKTIKRIQDAAERLLQILVVIQVIWAIIHLILDEKFEMGALLATVIRHTCIGLFFLFLIRQATKDAGILHGIAKGAANLATGTSGEEFEGVAELYSQMMTALGEYWNTASSILSWYNWGSWALCVVVQILVIWGVGTIIILVALTQLEFMIIGATGIILVRLVPLQRRTA